jgi:hypothetical protein
LAQQNDRLTQAAWMKRVLGLDVADAGILRAGEAAKESGSGVAYAKLLLRWEQSQKATAANVAGFAARILADEDIRADPRFADVEQAVSKFSASIPKFGEELRDALDTLANKPFAERADERDAARKLVGRYRGILDTAESFAELSEISEDFYGADLIGDLDAALAAIDAELARAA